MALGLLAVAAIGLAVSVGFVLAEKLRGRDFTKNEKVSPYAVEAEHLVNHGGEFCFHVHPNGDSTFSKRTCAHDWDDKGGLDTMMATLGPEVWYHEQLDAAKAAIEAGEPDVETDLDDELFLPASGVRLYSEHGLRVMALHEIPIDGHVYIVPQGLHFVWPMKHVGWSFEPQTMKEHPVDDKPIRLVQLSESPRVFSIENFMSAEEMAQLIEYNKDKIAPSEVGFAGKSGDSTRTSSTSWDFHSTVARRVQKRAFDVIGWEFDHALADAVQVLNYEPTQWYKPHTDWFDSKSYKGHDPTVNNGTNRFATVFLYLNDVGAGGHTVFPLSRTHASYNGEYLTHKGTEKTPGYISNKDAKWVCNTSSTALRSDPIAGNAVLFYSQLPNGTLDRYSLHGGCPVIDGHKWSANVWIWNRPKPSKEKALDGEGTGKKKDGGIDVTFVNNLPHPVYIFWDNMAGSGGPEDDGLTPWGKYEPEERLAMHTFPGHMFRFKDESGNLIKSWPATNKDGDDIFIGPAPVK